MGTPKSKLIASHGMNEDPRQALRENLNENLEIARQCRDGAALLAEKYPIAARILAHEARHWQGS